MFAPSSRATSGDYGFRLKSRDLRYGRLECEIRFQAAVEGNGVGRIPWLVWTDVRNGRIGGAGRAKGEGTGVIRLMS